MAAKPKALSTIIDRAVTAKEERYGTSEALRLQMTSEFKAHAIELAQAKLDTATEEDDWVVNTTIDGYRMALVLEISPIIKVVIPKGGSDFMLMLGTDPHRWPTIRDLAHLGALVDENGLR